MDTQKSRFNRILFIILLVLFVLTIAALSYIEWVASSGEASLWIILLNVPLLAIPQVLLYGSIYILVAGWREKATLGQVSPGLGRVIRWAPRVAAILFIFFISLFSLDVFEMEASPLELLGGFLIHNIPSIIMLVLLILAWKRPFVGFAAFSAIAVILTGSSIISAPPNEGFVFSPSMLLFVVPVLFIAGLYYAEWQWLKPQHPARVDSAT